MKKEKIIFYLGYHNGDTGKSPNVQDEMVEPLFIEPKKAGALLRAMKEVMTYLLIGEGDPL